MINHLIEEEDFYLKERAYHKALAEKHPALKDVCEKNADLCTSIVLQTKNQIRKERDEGA